MKYFVIFLVLIGFTATLFIIPHAFAEQSDPPPVPEPKDDHKSHVDGEPFCGLGAIYQDGICIVDKTGEKFVGSSSDKWEGHAYSLTVFEAPLKQFKSGITIEEIKCKDNLRLILKTGNNSPACVKPETIPKLIKRGWGEPAPEPEIQQNTTNETNFDSEKYYEEFGSGSPLIYKNISKPVLDYDNCKRYAFWLTEHQKEKIDKYEDYPRYPPWGNQIFPLVDYCTTEGNLVKAIVDEKIHWEFQLENEN